MAQSPAERRAAQRRLAKQIKTGTYKPSEASKQAREAARRLREKPAGPRDGEEVFKGGQRYDIKIRIKTRKRRLWEDTIGFKGQRSDRAVDESDDTAAMREVEHDSEDRWLYLASQASYAQAALDKNGDAGELEIYLPFTFLFYH